MDTALFMTGMGCIIAAIVGGGFKGLGIETPVIHTVRRQVVLALAGAMLAVLGYQPAPPTDNTYGPSTAEVASATDSDGSTFSLEPSPEEVLASSLAAYDSGDLTNAAEGFRRSAEAGNKEAQFHYAEVLEHGEGVVPDPVAAHVWMKRSAESGFAPAQAGLAIQMRKGTGTAVDLQAARIWAERSANQGDTIGLLVLGSMTEDPNVQKQLYMRAAATGHAIAQTTLATRLLQDVGTKREKLVGVMPEIVTISLKAALQGEQRAQIIVAESLRFMNKTAAAHLWICRALLSQRLRGFEASPEDIEQARTMQRELESTLDMTEAGRNRLDAQSFEPELTLIYRHGH